MDIYIDMCIVLPPRACWRLVAGGAQVGLWRLWLGCDSRRRPAGQVLCGASGAADCL